MTDSNALFRALRSNALFSSLSAITMFLAAHWLAEQLGIASVAIIYAVATGLLVFALLLGIIVYRRSARRWEIHAIIAGDMAWVAGSIAYIAVFYPTLTMTGLLLVDIAAVIVFYFAVQQIRGLRDYSRDSNILAG